MNNFSVLLIDDDADDKEMFCEAIGEINSEIECEWAKNASEAIETLKNTEAFPHIIFLDLNMPGINGKQCLAKIKAKKEWAHIPVYIYTTSKLDSDIKETLSLGAAGFITKPTTYHELKQSLFTIIDSKNSYS